MDRSPWEPGSVSGVPGGEVGEAAGRCRRIFSRTGAFLMLLLLAAVCLTGCATWVLQSSPRPVPVDRALDDSEANAVGYFLPKAMIRCELSAVGDSTEVKVFTDLVPDPAQFYLLHYKANPASDDQVNITLNQQGMLQEIEVTTEDKSGEIIVKLAELVKEALKVSFGLPSGVKAAPRVLPGVRYWKAVFDPRDLLNRSQTLDSRQGQEITITLKDPRNGRGADHGPATQRGIYYRPLMPYTLEITRKSGGVDNIYSQIIYLPNFAPIIALDVTGAAFVKKVTKLTFADGILSKVAITKPSELEAAILIPYNIVKSFALLPTEIIQFKYNYSTENKKLLEAQAAEIKARDALIEALKKEKDLQSKGNNGGN